VIRTLLDGVQIPWTRRPPHYRRRGYAVAAADEQGAKAELARWLAAGYLKELTPEEAADVRCVVGAFVTHSAGKPCLVVDYRHPNAFMERRRFKYETLWKLAPGLRSCDHMVSWDVKDAYHHLRLREADQTYLAFTLFGRVFVPVSMPFGLAVAPYTWTKVCRPVVGRLREMGFVFKAYVDDFGGRPPVRDTGQPATKADARRGWRTVADLMASLGLTVHLHKAEREKTMEQPLLGHVVDTRLGVFLLQPQRVMKIETMAAALLRYAAKHRRWMRLGTLRSLCGTAISTTLSVPQARCRTQSLFAAMRPPLRHGGGTPGRRDLRLGHQALADLKWWSGLSTHALIGGALWPPDQDAVIFTDASMTGWGAAWNGTVPARGSHAPARRHIHINFHKLVAMRLALLPLVDYFRPAGTVIRLMMDSLVCVHVVNNGTSRSEAMMAQLRRLQRVCARFGVQVRASHLPSAVNHVADKLSRSRDSTDWSLSDTAFRRLENKYGPHTVDVFAMSTNNKCGRYYSATADPGTAGVDAMQQSWWGENCWCNPPFQLLAPVVDKIVRQRSTATLIAPVWQSQAWWHRALQECTAYEVLPAAEGVFTHGARDTPARATTWAVAALRFEAPAAFPLSCAGIGCVTA